LYNYVLLSLVFVFFIFLSVIVGAYQPNGIIAI